MTSGESGAVGQSQPHAAASARRRSTMLSPEAADSISEDSFEVPVEEHMRPRE